MSGKSNPRPDRLSPPSVDRQHIGGKAYCPPHLPHSAQPPTNQLSSSTNQLSLSTNQLSLSTNQGSFPPIAPTFEPVPPAGPPPLRRRGPLSVSTLSDALPTIYTKVTKDITQGAKSSLTQRRKERAKGTAPLQYGKRARTRNLGELPNLGSSVKVAPSPRLPSYQQTALPVATRHRGGPSTTPSSSPATSPSLILLPTEEPRAQAGASPPSAFLTNSSVQLCPFPPAGERRAHWDAGRLPICPLGNVAWGQNDVCRVNRPRRLRSHREAGDKRRDILPPLMAPAAIQRKVTRGKKRARSQRREVGGEPDESVVKSRSGEGKHRAGNSKKSPAQMMPDGDVTRWADAVAADDTSGTVRFIPPQQTNNDRRPVDGPGKLCGQPAAPVHSGAMMMMTAAPERVAARAGPMTTLVQQDVEMLPPSKEKPAQKLRATFSGQLLASARPGVHVLAHGASTSSPTAWRRPTPVPEEKERDTIKDCLTIASDSDSDIGSDSPAASSPLPEVSETDCESDSSNDESEPASPRGHRERQTAALQASTATEKRVRTQSLQHQAPGSQGMAADNTKMEDSDQDRDPQRRPLAQRLTKATLKKFRRYSEATAPPVDPKGSGFKLGSGSASGPQLALARLRLDRWTPHACVETRRTVRPGQRRGTPHPPSRWEAEGGARVEDDPPIMFEERFGSIAPLSPTERRRRLTLTRSESEEEDTMGAQYHPTRDRTEKGSRMDRDRKPGGGDTTSADYARPDSSVTTSEQQILGASLARRRNAISLSEEEARLTRLQQETGRRGSLQKEVGKDTEMATPVPTEERRPRVKRASTESRTKRPQ